MFRIRYMKSCGLVTLISMDDIVPVAGHEIIEVPERPHFRDDQHLYYVNGQFEARDLNDQV